jgi:hypothetical protein
MTTNLQPVHDSSASLHDSPGFVAQRVRDTLPPELRDIVHRASELVRTRQLRLRETPLITSVTGIDRLLGGGLPRGTLVELVGRGSCGRFASLLAALKMVTDTGEVAALVDQGDQLDPQSGPRRPGGPARPTVGRHCRDRPRPSAVAPSPSAA